MPEKELLPDGREGEGGPTPMTVEDVERALGLMPRAMLYDAWTAIRRKDAPALLDIAAKAFEFNHDVRLCTELLRAVIDEAATMGRMTPEIDRRLDILMRAKMILPRSQTPRIDLEVALLKLVVTPS